MAIKTIPFVNTATYFWPVSPLQLNIKRIRGVYSGATAKLYMQLHQGIQNTPTDTDISLPANGVAPIEEFQIAPGWNFSFDVSYDPITDALAPMILALSTTAGALTAATTETLIDVFVDVEVTGDAFIWNGLLGLAYQIPNGYNLYTNNALSAVAAVWANGATSHELLEIVAYQASGSTAYLKLFTASPTTGVSVPWIEFPIPNAQNAPFQRFVFGSNVGNGLIPQTSSKNVLTNGLYVTMESAAGAYVSGNVVNFQLQVKYK